MNYTGLISFIVLLSVVLACGGRAARTANNSGQSTSQTAEANMQEPQPAPSPTESERAEQDAKEWIEFVKKVDKKNDIILSAEVRPESPHRLRITVSNSFHAEPYQNRLQSAQTMWKIWAGIHSPSEPDKSFISIVDRLGNEVGGSRAIAGSLIWVQDH
jgi:pyruvate/2-oxoglutarate dehydrogenase complex dihydrolipoamide acyltransferase (E2) component